MALVLVFVTTLQLFSIGQAVELTVGIYNQIPDLNKDKLASYKNLIENGFKSFNNGENSVHAIVDEDLYNPYGNLEEFLSAGGYDMIEMDMASLKDVVNKDLVIEVPDGNFLHDMLPAALKAVVINGKSFAYPTLVCGNFLVSLTPQMEQCDLMKAASNYDALHSVMEQCKDACAGSYERTIGGKMNDADGWYLPSLYLDGYIDIHGPDSVEKAIAELSGGIVDKEVCAHLSWFIGNCNDETGKNKCYDNFQGSYVQSSSNVYPDVEKYKTYIYFGFSEKAAQIERDSPRSVTAAISWPLGPQNIPLQFTDALVINKARWNVASEEKRNAILQFVTYFLGNDLRTKIAMGEDLNEPRARYLLQASTTFYKETSNPIYLQLFPSLEIAVPSPSLTEDQMLEMEKVLTDHCVQAPVARDREEL